MCCGFKVTCIQRRKEIPVWAFYVNLQTCQTRWCFWQWNNDIWKFGFRLLVIPAIQLYQSRGRRYLTSTQKTLNGEGYSCQKDKTVFSKWEHFRYLEVMASCIQNDDKRELCCSLNCRYDHQISLHSSGSVPRWGSESSAKYLIAMENSY